MIVALADTAPSATVHAALAASLNAEPQTQTKEVTHALTTEGPGRASLAPVQQLREHCAVCAESGEQRGGHVDWPEGPTLCQKHFDRANYMVRSEGVDFERAVSMLCMAEDERVAAECAGAA